MYYSYQYLNSISVNSSNLEYTSYSKIHEKITILYLYVFDLGLN